MSATDQVIEILNRSTALTDAQIEATVPALQAHMDDVTGAWGLSRILVEFAGQVARGDWWLDVLDNTDTPGAGGYHVSERGRVSGKIFAADAIASGEAWTVDATHELAEMAVDPSAGTDPSKFIALQGQYAGAHCLREVCDACEADQYAYLKEAPDRGFDVPGCMRSGSFLIVPVSDFVLPPYFYEPEVAPPARMPDQPVTYDFRGYLRQQAPGLLPGGYLGLQRPDGSWTQVSDFMLSGMRSRRSMRHGRTAHAVAAHMHHRAPSYFPGTTATIDPNYDPYTSGQTASPDDGKDSAA